LHKHKIPAALYRFGQL